MVAQRQALIAQLKTLLQLKGVIAACKYEVTPQQDFRLPRVSASVGSLSGDIAWWVMHCCDMAMTLCQAETIDYDNVTGTRRFFPPGAVCVRGKELSFLGTANRVVVVVRNAARPDLWAIVARMQAIEEEAWRR